MSLVQDVDAVAQREVAPKAAIGSVANVALLQVYSRGRERG